ncbi:hypothetical protein [Streptomyces sp. 8L]|uniref:hypothetical protein n=1 Tax=Streptomyces sp. 8L TaxID=2877242 RepID=UPI001CD5BF05|nr:hypothetical protein [Streptomyces sp. 8L]MCA1217898.1 hypothetical protein [Streptomyces sp. 8L]
MAINLRAPLAHRIGAGLLLVAVAGMVPAQAASAATPTSTPKAAAAPSYSADLAAGAQEITPDSWITGVVDSVAGGVAGGVAGAVAAAKFAAPAAEDAAAVAAEASSSSSSSSSGNAQIYAGIAGDNQQDIQFDAAIG